MPGKRQAFGEEAMGIFQLSSPVLMLAFSLTCDIMVGGKNAVTSEETRCESFAQKRGDSMTNSTCHPSRTISIDCEVARCVYNANYKCTAEHVDISGSNADTSRETSCSTFKEK